MNEIQEQDLTTEMATDFIWDDGEVGVVLSNHRDESLVVETEAETVTLRLEKERRRWGEGEPQTKYQFRSVETKEAVS